MSKGGSRTGRFPCPCESLAGGERRHSFEAYVTGGRKVDESTKGLKQHGKERRDGARERDVRRDEGTETCRVRVTLDRS